MRERKLELLVAAIVLGILLTLLLSAIGSVQREVEEAAVQAEISALRIELLGRLAHREGFGGRLPDSNNPVVWAVRQPHGYAGELKEAPAEHGVWYYDTNDEVLVYRSRHLGDLRFRLTRAVARLGAPAVLAGVGLLRLDGTPIVK